jgi:hypothetical protein
MRSILILFVIAALGFAVILKKDDPKPAKAPAPKKRTQQVALPDKHNWVKYPLEETSALGHVAVNERER